MSSDPHNGSPGIQKRKADHLALCASGEVIWQGDGSLGPDDGRIAFYLTDHFARLAQPTTTEATSQSIASMRASACTRAKYGGICGLARIASIAAASRHWP